MLIISFGYGSGDRPVPKADLIIDCRLLANPHRLPLLRKLDGRNLEVKKIVRASRGYESLMNRAIDFAHAHPGPETKIAFGCMAGKHRSVACAEILAEALKIDSRKFRTIQVSHRSLSPIVDVY